MPLIERVPTVGAMVILATMACTPDAGRPAGAGATSSEAAVDIGVLPLEVRRIGTGAPLVVFEAGFINSAGAMRALQDKVGTLTSTLAYSRAGLGASAPGPEPRAASQIANELARLLDTLGVAQPVIIVGHSAGGVFARVFAHRFPSRVAGLVLVDPATEEHWEFVRTSNPARWDDFEREVRKEFGVPPPGWTGQWRALPVTIREAAASFPLPEVPVRVLSALQPLPGDFALDSAMIGHWVGAHERLVARVPGATHIKIETTDHMGILDRDELLRSIRDLIERSRARL